MGIVGLLFKVLLCQEIRAVLSPMDMGMVVNEGRRAVGESNGEGEELISP